MDTRARETLKTGFGTGNGAEDSTPFLRLSIRRADNGNFTFQAA